jgi:MoaA/NifB/PqqE/SkfB family radical SAM enzyme
MKYSTRNPFNPVNMRILRECLRNPAKTLCMLSVRHGAKKAAVQYFDKRKTFVPPPVTVIFRLTHKCNQRCIQCGQWGESGVFKNAGQDLFTKEMSYEQITSVIKNVARFHAFISFFGGEPTLRDDCHEIIGFASRLGLLTNLNTNGLLLEDKAQQLVKAGLDFIKVSLDGTIEINGQIRKAPNSFERTFAGIKKLLEMRNSLKSSTPVIQVCTTITKENQYHLYDIACIANDLGVDVFAVLFGIFTTHLQIKESDRITSKKFGFASKYWQGFVMDRSDMDIAAISEQIKRIKARKWKFLYRQYPADTTAFNISRHYKEPQLPHGAGKCIVPWFRMQIMPNGDVALCEDTPDYVAGNVLQSDILSIWNGERYRNFRQYILDNGIFPVCARCSALYEIPHFRNTCI